MVVDAVNKLLPAWQRASGRARTDDSPDGGVSQPLHHASLEGQMKAARRVMKKRRNVLRKLAK